MNTSSPLYKRYAGALSSAATLNETCETIIGHRSCRDYLDQEVSRETLDLLIAAAQSATSYCNMQSWSVVAITDPAIKEQIRTISGQANIEKAPLFPCFVAEIGRANV